MDSYSYGDKGNLAVMLHLVYVLRAPRLKPNKGMKNYLWKWLLCPSKQLFGGDLKMGPGHLQRDHHLIYEAPKGLQELKREARAC